MPVIALVPARMGSQRLPRKNLRELGGFPLLTWTLRLATTLNLFDEIIVSTDSREVIAVALASGATHTRMDGYGHHDEDPDIRWVRPTLERWGRQPLTTCVLLRPTSPFRTTRNVRAALEAFRMPDGTHDSLRAVRRVTEHPGKMWEWKGDGYPMTPLLGEKRHPDGTPWHSSPTQSLPSVYVQTSSLEIFWAANVWSYGTIHGRKVLPWVVDTREGFSLDTPDDWADAERLVATGTVQCPAVDVGPLPTPAASV